MPLRPYLFAALALAAFLVGCGGGGGGGSSAAFTYRTQWTGRAAGGPTGQSQHVQIIDPGGAQATSLILNRGVLDQADLSAYTAGGYVAKITLYSLADLGGVETGTLSIPIAEGASGPLTSIVGELPTTVSLSPPDSSIALPETKRFYAAGRVGTNYVFTLASDFTWSVLGGVGTVDSGGLVSATTVGSGSVRVNHVPTGRSTTSGLTVTASGARKTKWTVLVYLNAANDLSEFDVDNVNGLEEAAGNADVRFVIQWKQVRAYFDESPEFVGTRRYLVKEDQSSTIASELIQDMGQGVDMGSEQTLSDFVGWAKTYYPADRYALIIWNHGNGWRRSATASVPPTRGVSYDDDTGNSIETWELAQAVGATRWDILAWDASLMQMMEVAHELKDTAGYIVGSEESPPGEGWAYSQIFKTWRDNPGASSLELARAIVDGNLAFWGSSSRKITWSVLDTSQMDGLASATSQLGTALKTNVASLGSVVTSTRTAAKGYSVSSPRYYYDLGDICKELEARTAIPAVTAASAAVRQAIGEAVVYEKHNAASEGSTGISIDFSPSSVYNPSSSGTYGLLRFARDTQWDEWLGVAP